MYKDSTFFDLITSYLESKHKGKGRQNSVYSLSNIDSVLIRVSNDLNFRDSLSYSTYISSTPNITFGQNLGQMVFNIPSPDATNLFSLVIKYGTGLPIDSHDSAEKLLNGMLEQNAGKNFAHKINLIRKLGKEYDFIGRNVNFAENFQIGPVDIDDNTLIYSPKQESFVNNAIIENLEDFLGRNYTEGKESFPKLESQIMAALESKELPPKRSDVTHKEIKLQLGDKPDTFLDAIHSVTKAYNLKHENELIV